MAVFTPFALALATDWASHPAAIQDLVRPPSNAALPTCARGIRAAFATTQSLYPAALSYVLAIERDRSHRHISIPSGVTMIVVMETSRRRIAR